MSLITNLPILRDHVINCSMPAKKTILTDEQRIKNIRDAAEKIGASNDPKVLDKALKKVAASKLTARRPS